MTQRLTRPRRAWPQGDRFRRAREMPGCPMVLRAEFTDAQPLAGARITGSLHMTIQTVSLDRRPRSFGAEVRWCSCNIFDARPWLHHDRPRQRRRRSPRPVSRCTWKGESLEEYRWCTEQVRCDCARQGAPRSTWPAKARAVNRASR